MSYHFTGELSVSIREPSGPFGSDFVRLQIDNSRNITLVNTHTYEIECSSDVGISPIWVHDGVQVSSSQPSVGTSRAYVTEITDRRNKLVLQSLALSLVGAYVCMEGVELDVDRATLLIAIGAVGRWEHMSLTLSNTTTCLLLDA